LATCSLFIISSSLHQVEPNIALGTQALYIYIVIVKFTRKEN
jgi:hypothetical protein